MGRADSRDARHAIDPKEIARLVAERSRLIDTARAAKIRAARRDHKAGTKAREDAIEAAIHYLDDEEEAANTSTAEIIIAALQSMNKNFDPKGLDEAGLLGALKFACSKAGASADVEGEDDDEESEELEGGEPSIPDSRGGLPDPDATEQIPGGAEEATRQLRKRSADAWKTDARTGRPPPNEEEPTDVVQATRALRQRSQDAWKIPQPSNRRR